MYFGCYDYVEFGEERSENMSKIIKANSDYIILKLNKFVQVTCGKFSLRFNF